MKGCCANKSRTGCLIPTVATLQYQFVKGGVIDEDMYESCEIKFLMLLKEVNALEQTENWSLVTLIQDQVRKLRFYPI